MDAPPRRLSPLALWVWRLTQVFVWAVLLAIGIVVARNLDALGPLPWLVPAAGLVLGTLLIPPLRYSRWRWDVREEGIDIQSGAITVSRTLVPWVRVQHVDTRRGILEQAFGLSTVVVHTAAGSHTIPLLPREEAESLRERIAGLARAEAEEDVATVDYSAPPPVDDTPTPPAAPRDYSVPPPPTDVTAAPPHDAPPQGVPAPFSRPTGADDA